MEEKPEDKGGKKPKVPDTFEELFPEEKPEPQADGIPVILYPNPSYEQALKKRKRMYIIQMAIFILWLIGGQAALWGYVLLDIPWLRLPLALIAAGCLYSLGNFCILLLKRNHKLENAQSPRIITPQPLTPEEEKTLDDQQKKAQQEFIESHNKKITTCFSNYCNIAKKYSSEKAIRCLNCRISNACVIATNTRMMAEFHRKLDDGDSWRGEG